MRPQPTTFEHIECIALREPRRLAIVENRQGWDYAAVYLDLARVIRVLHDAGIQRGDRVAVGMTGYRWGLLVLFALENLGAATLSFLPGDDPDAQAVFGLVKWVVSDVHQVVSAPARFVRVDGQFVQQMSVADVRDAESVPRIALPLNEPQRITRTSGSTGKSKFMVFNRHLQELWVAGVARAFGFTPDTRAVMLGPLVLNGQYARASACLRMGATVLELSGTGLQGHDFTHLSALPVMLEEAMRSLPPGFVTRQPVRVSTVGGTVPASMRERIKRVFGTAVMSRYGMNEAGSVCEVIDDNGVGPLAAGVEVRIVDEAGNEVPPGQPGIIFVRTSVVVEGYIDNPAATQAAFHDGWFRTGDWGALVAPRMLRVAGRYDDLVNAGGIKVPAAHVEAQVHALVNPQDCAVLATHLDGGETSMGIALVMDGDPPRDDIRRRLAQGLKIGAAIGARVLFLRQIPRLANSKVDRVKLLRLFESPPPGSL